MTVYPKDAFFFNTIANIHKSDTQKRAGDIAQFQQAAAQGKTNDASTAILNALSHPDHPYHMWSQGALRYVIAHTDAENNSMSWEGESEEEYFAHYKLYDAVSRLYREGKLTRFIA